MSEITRGLAEFSINTRYEDLPPRIIKETKRVLMEHIGCALGGLTTDKGKMNAAIGRRYGGPPEASIIGTNDIVSCNSAALANGELMITLDYSDIIAGGHDGTYVIPSVLAMAEMNMVSGKDLVLATAIGLEVSARLARAVGRHNITVEDIQRQRQGKMGITGNAYSNFGAAAGAARLMGMDVDTTHHALGIAGHLCMVLSYGRWGADGHNYMAKYAVPGWQSTGAVTAVLLAEMGYIGDLTVLDNPERGFTFFTGYPNWYPEEITKDLGKDWCFDFRLHYKPYPCCGVFHSGLDCVYDIIEPNNIKAEEIESVTVYGRGMMGPLDESGKPVAKVPSSISAAQFNMPYNISVACHRITRGVEWVDHDTINNPDIINFMPKVSIKPNPDYDKVMSEDPLSALSKVDIVARGQTFTVERQYRKGTTGTEASATDDDIIGKFKHNAERILTKHQIENAVDALTDIENLEDITELIDYVTV